jgi:hypothetical protein
MLPVSVSKGTRIMPRHEPRIDYLGTEQHPVVVIDDFVPSPDVLIEDAAMLGFQPIGPYYPGIRAAVPKALVSGFWLGLDDLVAQTFNLAAPFSVFESYYSIVTTPPAALQPIQRLPHFDSVEPDRIALLHYISRTEQGGTAFFRHRATGFESISPERHTAYGQSLQRDVAQYGLPPAEYISGDTAMFEQIAQFDATFNRAIIYRGNMLHCAHIADGLALSADPATGRLTVNTFLIGNRS